MQVYNLFLTFLNCLDYTHLLIYNNAVICKICKINKNKERKMKKRIISAILLTLVAIFAFIPAISLTAEAADSGTYTLVTDASSLHSGDKIVIVAKDYNYALSTTQNKNNRGQAAVTKSDDSITFGNDVQIITLEEGKVSDTFAFNVGDGYLYAASSSSNYLRTETTLSNNSSWRITVDADGVATIKAQGTNTKNTIYYNKSSSLFSAYSSAQQSVCIYKLDTSVSACTHTNTTTTTVDATCTTEGSVTVTCDNCKEVLSTETLSTIDHTYVDGVCSVCGEKEPSEIVFNFGENGSATHKDGSSSEENYTETTGGYTLSITNGTRMYPNSYDAQGNSAIKMGTSEKTGSFTLTVPDDVIKVVIYVAGYKAKTVGITINGGDVITVESLSDNGEYTAIEIDTSSVKEVTFATTTNYRCMIDKIIYHLDANACAHENYTSETTDSTCTENGYTTYTCTECGHTYTDNETPALGHTWDKGVTTVEPGITTEGEKTYTCDVCKATKTEVLSAKGYTATFAVPGGITPPKNRNGLSISLPELESTTYTDENGIEYTFVGWSAEKFDDETNPTFNTANDRVDLREDTVFYAVYRLTTDGNGGNGDYELTDLSKILATDKVVIVFTHSNGTTYAVTNTNGTSKAPGGTKVTISGNKLSAAPADNLIWNISNSSGNLTIYPNGDTSTWLYCTSTNNGVRVGTNANKVFTLDSTTGYLKHTATSRYLGIYSATPDLRCYTTHTVSNIANQTVAFYVQSSGGTTTYKTIGCIHENATVEKTATCTESGQKITTCPDCGYSETKDIGALGHDYANGEVSVTNPTCTSGGYTITTCARCDETKTTDVTEAIAHSYNPEGICTVCGALNAAVYDLSGKYYISTVRASGNYRYMSGLLHLGSDGKTLRYSAIDSGLTTLPESINSPDLTSIFVLERITDGDDAGKYLIYAYGIVGEEKYVGWTEGNSAILVSRENAKRLTVENVHGKKSFTFSFTEGEDTRYLSLNDNYDYFAFYKGTENQNLSLVPIQFPAGDTDEFTGASLNIGSDLSIRYHVIPSLNNALDDYTVRFTMNGKVVTVQGVAEGTKLVFSCREISPQFMGSSIKAELLLDGEVIDTKENYSVKQYVIDALALHSTDTYLCTLLSDVLYYGAAAQIYLNKNVVEEALVTYGVENLTPSEITTTDTDKQRNIVTEEGADTTLVKFTAAGVRFDYNNRIYVKFTTEDASSVTVTVNGTALEIIPLGGNTYVAYSEGISALEFDNTVSFKLNYGEDLIQTLNYTVNTYAWDKNGDSTIGDLALALYRYGKSAEAYEISKSISY